VRVYNFQIFDVNDFEKLQSFCRIIDKNHYGNCHLSGEIGEEFNLSSLSIESVINEELMLTIHKLQPDGFYLFFSPDGFQEALKDNDFIFNAKKVWILDEFEMFSSLTTWFLPWESEPPFELDTKNITSDPRKLVRDLSDRNIVTKNVAPWLLYSDDFILLSSNIFDIWKNEAAKKLAFTLPSEITKDKGDNINATIRGEQYHSLECFPLTSDNYKFSFVEIYNCAKWIYASPHESDSKHTLFNYHLALELSHSVIFPDSKTLEAALNNATLAYGLHLFDKSKETIKYLTELKKSLHEEVSRSSENTRGLVNGLWRDFIISIGVVALNFSSKANSISDIGLKTITLATALIILINYFVSVVSIYKINKIIENNRKDWHKILYGFINNDDFERLVSCPLKRGARIFWVVAFFIFIIYLGIAVTLFNI